MKQNCFIHQHFLVKKIAVVGSGPAGLAAATVAAKRGHNVTIFEGRETIGGQFLFASKIPGKEEFIETIRYFNKMIEVHNITLKIKYLGECRTI